MSTHDLSKADRPRSASVRIALYLAPVVWAVQFGANYALEPVSCHQQTRFYLWTIGFTALLAALFAAWKGWSVLRETLGAEPADRDVESVRFLAVSGLALSTLCALVIFAQLLPTFFFQPCQ